MASQFGSGRSQSAKAGGGPYQSGIWSVLLFAVVLAGLVFHYSASSGEIMPHSHSQGLADVTAVESGEESHELPEKPQDELRGDLRPPFLRPDQQLTVAEQAELVRQSEQQILQKILGRWKLEDSIQREITIRDDGTATMLVKLDYFTALIYGRELTLELRWKFEKGILSQWIVGGHPEANVKSITKAFGDHADYKIVNVDTEELLLEGPLTSKKKEHWKALPPH